MVDGNFELSKNQCTDSKNESEDSKGATKTSIVDPGSAKSLAGSFTTSSLVSWAWQIARGMQYLVLRKVRWGLIALAG